MRRKDREITDRTQIDAIMERVHVCHLAMVDEGEPYVVPMNFGYADGALYLHGACKGKKVEVLKKNNHVCFAITDPNYQIVLADESQNSTTYYDSVIGFGKAYFLDDRDEKIAGLNVLLKQSGHPRTADNLPEAMLNSVAVIKVVIDSMTGKSNHGE